MRLEGRIYAGERMLKLAIEEIELRPNVPFTKSLDVALIKVCHALNLPNIVWMSKNTREFAKYRQTIFSPEQFAEPVDFSQFQIKLIEGKQHE